MMPEDSRETMLWQIRPSVHPISVLTLLECVTETASALEEFGQIARQHPTSGTLMLAKTRQISVALRKILLDGNGSLLKRCIENPEMHPMKAPVENAKTLRGTQSFKKQEYILHFADGSSSTLKIQEFDHTVSVHPLYGINHESDSSSVLTSPFNCVAKTVKFSKWMNTKILEVNGMQFDTRSVLHLMAVNEGAHTNERLSMMGPVLPDEDNDARYSAIDGIKFGVFSYIQFFSLFTGLYLVNRFREVFGPGALTSNDPRAKEMCQLIHLYPRDFPLLMNSSVSIATNPFYVLARIHRRRALGTALEEARGCPHESGIMVL